MYLSVFEGRIADTQPGNNFFVAPWPELVYSNTDTRRFGEQLHVAVVTAKLPAPLLPNKVYSYLIQIGNLHDLKSLGLLSNNIDPIRPQVPLGYDLGFLPSFVAPPADVNHLIVLHGSCRKMHGGPAPDALAFADAIVSKELQSPLRPHQLFLTGDQIYADDVPSAVLPELTKLGRELLGVDELVTAGKADHPVTVKNFPPGRRQKLVSDAGLSSPDAASHLLSFGEFAAAYLFAWSNAVWPDALPDKTVIDPTGIAPPTDASLTPFASEEYTDIRAVFDAEVVAVSEYRQRLPEVRRLLANIPVAMIFDDHEISDDWFITDRWRTRALGNPLGRAIIRNGLAAYAVFQGWGNDPEYFAKLPGKDLLDDVAALFPSGTPGPVATRKDALEKKLGMSDASATVTWHYMIEHTSYRFVVLDTRTRRVYPSYIGPPGLLADDALAAQLPSSLTPLDVTIVVSAAPVLGVPMVESFLGKNYLDGLTYIGSYEAASLTADWEAWAFDEVAFESLLERLYDLKHVVLLSGDVHYGFSTSLTYWRDPEDKATFPRRIVQLTSSALKNPWPVWLFKAFTTAEMKLVFDNLRLSVAKLGWHVGPPGKPPVTIAVAGWNPHTEELTESLSTVRAGLPSGSTASRKPEWAWRLRVETDGRDEFDGTPQSRPKRKEKALGTTIVDIALIGFDWRYGLFVLRNLEQAKAPQTVVWNPNIGAVRFFKSVVNTVVNTDVWHALLYANPYGDDPNLPQPWLEQVIRFGEVDDEVAPALTDP